LTLLVLGSRISSVAVSIVDWIDNIGLVLNLVDLTHELDHVII